MRHCKHQNGELIEHMEATHTRSFKDGILGEIGYNEDISITDYEFYCEDCCKSWRFRAEPSHPKWLRDIYWQLRKRP